MTSGRTGQLEYDGRDGGHPVLAALALVVGCLCLAGGIAMVFARTQIIDGTALRERSLSALDDAALRHELAARIADEAQGAVPAEIDPTNVRAAVDDAVQTDAFRSAFGSMVLASRDAVLNAASGSITLPLAAAAPTIAAQVEAIDPAVGAEVRRVLSERSLQITDAGDLTTLARLMRAARVLAYVLPAVAILCFVLALVLGRRVSTALIAVGLAIAVAGGLVALATILGRGRVGDVAGPGGAAPALALWDALIGDLRTWGIVAALVGGGIMLVGVIASLAGGRQRVAT